MKTMRQKIADIMSIVYGIGILIALILGTLSFLGYIVAFILGGKAAGEICEFIYKTFYPHLFSFSSFVVLLGLVKMYVAGEKAMVPSKRSPQKKESEQKSEKEK